MPISQPPAQPDPSRREPPPLRGSEVAVPRLGGSVSARVWRLPTSLAIRVGDAVWSFLHVLGAHRWQDGYETDAERGWSRYRGSHCTICDQPWEGW
jgi:hypothetical protein